MPTERALTRDACVRLQLEVVQQHRVVQAGNPEVGTSAALRRDVVRLAVVLVSPVRGTQQLIHTLRFLASPTSLEPGCLGCRVWTEGDEESLVRYEEAWATEEAMRLRVRSEGFTRLLEVLESAPEAPRVQFDFIMESRGLDYVEEVRNNARWRGTRPTPGAS